MIWVIYEYVPNTNFKYDLRVERVFKTHLPYEIDPACIFPW